MVFAWLLCTALTPSGIAHELVFSTYLGGSGNDQARDITADANGNIYVVGGSGSDDFPTTPGVIQRTQDKTGTNVGSLGYLDATVSKYDPQGNLVWSTYLGGPNYDRAYAVEVDDQGCVYVAGRAGPGFPVTTGSLQPTFKGSSQGIYGQQNGFVTKLSPDGTAILWSTYVGVGYLCRDLAIDEDHDVYVPLSYKGSGSLPPTAWFANAYQPSPKGGDEVGVLKISASGSTALWATWVGGTGDEADNAGVVVDKNKNVFLHCTTVSADMPTTTGAHDSTYNGLNDAYIAKISPDGKNLVFGTYFGGSGNEAGNNVHNLAVDPAGNCYLATHTSSTNITTTPGVFQSTLAGGSLDVVVAKFSPSGALMLCTYVGGNGNDGTEAIAVNASGDLFFVGNTTSTNFPVTPTALQLVKSSNEDAGLVVVASDFASLKYATYLGGVNVDQGRAAHMDDYGTLYMAGTCDGTGWPIFHAWQSVFAGNGPPHPSAIPTGDCVVTKIKSDFKPRISIKSSHYSEGSFTLHWDSLPQWERADVYRSPDLANWGVISASNGAGWFTDSSPPNTKAFYAVVPEGNAHPSP